LVASTAASGTHLLASERPEKAPHWAEIGNADKTKTTGPENPKGFTEGVARASLEMFYNASGVVDVERRGSEEEGSNVARAH
jgi:hypothetical protein